MNGALSLNKTKYVTFVLYNYIKMHSHGTFVVLIIFIYHVVLYLKNYHFKDLD